MDDVKPERLKSPHRPNAGRKSSISANNRRGPVMNDAIATRYWLTVCIVMWMVDGTSSAICPSRCVCNDDNLEAACVDAGLEVVPIQLNPDLKQIDLQENRINSVHFTLGFYTNLRTLDVSKNKITSLGSRNFEFQSKLLSLKLSNNLVGHVSKDTFRGLKSLRVLNLSDNQLETLDGSVFFHLSTLIELDVKRNKILDIGKGVFEKMTNLLVLKLDGNQLLEIPTQSLLFLPKLQYLGLGGNLIETIPYDATPVLYNLRSLTLDSNVISYIDRAAFDGLSSLEYLTLHDNNLTINPTFALAKLNHLTYLDLSGNYFDSLSSVAFQSLFELRSLKLSRLSRLYSIDPRAFVDNIKLEQLEMNDNEMLLTLPWRLFLGNPSLVEVSVRGNGFTTLDAANFPLDQLKTLSVAGNPLVCNCSLLWLWLLVVQQQQTFVLNDTSIRLDAKPAVDFADIRCAAPAMLERQLLVSVLQPHVRCESPWRTAIIISIVVFVLFAVTCIVILYVTREHCKKKEVDHESLDNQPRLHQNNGVLMMLGQKDSLDDFVLRTRRELMNSLESERQYQHRETWEHDMGDVDDEDEEPTLGAYNRQYTLNGTLKKPKHVAYV